MVTTFIRYRLIVKYLLRSLKIVPGLGHQIEKKLQVVRPAGVAGAELAIMSDDSTPLLLKYVIDVHHRLCLPLLKTRDSSGLQPVC